MIFDYMETDLHAVNRAGILEEVHIQFIIYQILKALKYMHSGDLVHRDLKPANILINSDCHIKIADFGLARSVAFNTSKLESPVMTEYVATRWYRAPEILLSSQKYTKSVDVWSVGCILGELLNRKAIFPGTSTLNQIEKVMELLGKPKPQDIDSMESEMADNIIRSINLTRRRSFQNFFPNAGEEALDFLKRALSFNPNSRMTIEEALRHPYLKKFSNANDEKVLTTTITIPMDENTKFSIKDYREMLYREIMNKKKENRKIWQDKYFKKFNNTNQFKNNMYYQPNRTLVKHSEPAAAKIVHHTSTGNMQTYMQKSPY